mmetsp:Transcript_10298/g.23545  ORF Transcript_10298/g.23545 Transcript_10298/m.23545 type:complete len:202 (+) Transcript_10298:159-764(+)
MTLASAPSVIVQLSHARMTTTASCGISLAARLITSSLCPSTVCSFAWLGPLSSTAARRFASRSISSLLFVFVPSATSDRPARPSSSLGASSGSGSVSKSFVQTRGAALRIVATSTGASSRSITHRQSSTATASVSSPLISAPVHDASMQRARKVHFTAPVGKSGGSGARNSTSVSVWVHVKRSASPPEYLPGTENIGARRP